MQKTTLVAHYSRSPQKNGLRKQLIFEKRDDFKNWQKWPLQNGQFGSKIKIPKNMQKATLLEHYSCSMEKTVRKNS